MPAVPEVKTVCAPGSPGAAGPTGPAGPAGPQGLDLQMDSKWILNVMTPPPRLGEGAGAMIAYACI